MIGYLLGYYQSPSSNNVHITAELCNLLSLNFVTGDFNYKFVIHWSHNSIISTCQVANTFINTIHDCYLFQHVHKPTRFSPGQSSHILNLIFANEENMLGLENIDHIILFVSNIILITNQSYLCETSVVEIMIFIKQC